MFLQASGRKVADSRSTGATPQSSDDFLLTTHSRMKANGGVLCLLSLQSGLA